MAPSVRAAPAFSSPVGAARKRSTYGRSRSSRPRAARAIVIDSSRASSGLRAISSRRGAASATFALASARNSVPVGRRERSQELVPVLTKRGRGDVRAQVAEGGVAHEARALGEARDEERDQATIADELQVIGVATDAVHDVDHAFAHVVIVVARAPLALRVLLAHGVGERGEGRGPLDCRRQRRPRHGRVARLARRERALDVVDPGGVGRGGGRRLVGRGVTRGDDRGGSGVGRRRGDARLGRGGHARRARARRRVHEREARERGARGAHATRVPTVRRGSRGARFFTRASARDGCTRGRRGGASA